MSSDWMRVQSRADRNRAHSEGSAHLDFGGEHVLVSVDPRAELVEAHALVALVACIVESE